MGPSHPHDAYTRVLVKGGALPRQVREHFEGLMRRSVVNRTP